MNTLRFDPLEDLEKRVFNEITRPLLVVDDRLQIVRSNAAARRRLCEDAADSEAARAALSVKLQSDQRLRQIVKIAAGCAREFVVRPLFEEAKGGALYTVKQLPGEGRRLLLIAIRSAHRSLHLSDANEEMRQERRQALALRQHAKQLARLNQNLNRFAYAAAHDMQEPVRIIATLADALRNEPLPPERQEQYLDRIGRHARRARRIVRDILDFSEIRDVDLHFSAVDVAAVARAAWRSFQEVIEPSLETRFDLQAAGEITCDRKMLELVLCNLMSNSVKYRRDDFVHIELKGRGTSHYFELHYRDYGHGFDQAKAERIFEPFTRLRRSDEVEGTGIGLALCRSIIDRHRGRIWAVGRPGEGSDFFIRLPTLPEAIGTEV